MGDNDHKKESPDVTIHQKTADERSASRADGITKAFRVFDGLRMTLFKTQG